MKWRKFLRTGQNRLLARLEPTLKKIPAVNRRIETQYETLMADLEPTLKPYRDTFATYDRLPVDGRSHDDILSEIQALKKLEEARWRDGFVSGAVYHGQDEHIHFLNQVYALHSQSNPLHADLWPSLAKFEAEIVAMTAHMLGAGQTRPGHGVDEEICGTVSSGGTESILLAMKTYRDWARDKKGITRPEMIVPVTAHAAFDKAAQYFNIKLVRIPVDHNYRADWTAVREAITRNSIVIVGSAPSFPHGAIDPIEEMSTLALKYGVGFHTDACLGGFVLPWAKKLGYAVPPFDFRLPGVTSMSADTHKYGYAAKGTSVVLYRGAELRRYQYFTATDWPGGLYFSPTFAGSRPGALSAACWAAMVSLGEEGYLEATRRVLETAVTIREGIAAMPELRLLGHSLFVHAFTSDELDIYRVLDHMTRQQWSLNGLHHPPCIHLCVTLRHTQPGVAERFLTDLQTAVDAVKSQPQAEGGMAPVYGLAATLPLRGVVGELLKRYLDTLYKV
ncbi:MAG: aminotransferase class V-fold PLP-dependent enzyme [Anaerolineae bacterium]|nr:aminotransferase class V-fold PLP-dependent enzyme [Anaerolineae bacterium]